MLNVALTGNVAAGKSTVTELFRSWGATVIDADRLVRETQEPGSPVLIAIVTRFGPAVLRPDGTLDRSALRAIVLADPVARAALEAIVHPAVQARRAALLAEARSRGDRIVVNDIPLLFEALDPRDFDLVVLVDAPEPVRLDRLMRARGLPRIDAQRMIGVQLPAGTKRAGSDYIIENDGDLASLEARAREVWTGLLARAS